MPQEQKQRGVAILEEFALNNDTYYVRLAAYQGLMLLEDVPGVNEALAKIKKKEKDQRLLQIYDNL